MSERLRLAVAQMTSTDDTATNLVSVESLFASVAQADLVVFPENTLFFRVRSGSSVEGIVIDGPEVQRLQSLVEQANRALMLTTPLREQGDKLFNATLFFSKGQKPQVLYRKVHLFDVDVPGAPPVRESEFFVGGRTPAVFEYRGWKLGLSICYDLRFSELYAHYSQKVDVILVPSAFLVPTGEAHWEVLLRARAIESQCYVVAPAQSGEHHSKQAPEAQVRMTYGHSLVVEPWGRVLASFSGGVQAHIVDLTKEPIEKVRRQIPMSGHRVLG